MPQPEPIASKRSSTGKTTTATPPKRSAKPAKKAPAKAYHHGNLRESLLEAAQALLALHGVQGISLRDVAKVAGVSHAAPYHHFASLNDLLAAVAQRGFKALADAMAQATTEKDTRERLVQIALAYVRCARSHPGRFRLMFAPQLTQGDGHPQLREESQRAFAILLAAAHAHDAKNGHQLALCGWSLSHGMANLLIDGAFDKLPIKAGDDEALVRQLTLRALA